MHYCISTFAVTPQNYVGHIIEEKGENELIMENGMGQGQKRRRKRKNENA
jgi:hypothetical protein